MSRTRRAAATLISISVCATLGAGCGSSNSSSTVSPRAYVDRICGTVANWVSTVQQRSKALATKHPNSIPASKAELQTFLAQVVSDTDRAISGVKGAGVPQIGNGKQVAATLVQAFNQTRAILAQSQGSAAKLSVSDPKAFTAAASTLGTSTQTALTSVGTSLSALKAPELKNAASTSPACKQLSSATANG